MNDAVPPRLGVIGAEHLHLIQIVDALARAGAQTVAHTPDGSLSDLYAKWRSDSTGATAQEIIDDPTIGIVVTAGIPSERASAAYSAIAAGKAVVSAKPGVTTKPQLDALRDLVAERAGRPWTVVFTERLENRAVCKALAMVRDGAIGTPFRVRGSGPHTLAGDTRPEWFFDPERAGGIIVDLASHQVDQFLCVVGDSTDVTVVDAVVGNVATAQHPGWHDTGGFTLAAPGVEGHHSVDLVSPAGLGTWGDVRLEITGTSGTLEVRANIDVTGRAGGEHLIHVGPTEPRRIDVSEVPIDWAELLLKDLADDGERLMTQRHVCAVSELTLAAQAMARPWGSP